MAEGRQLSLNSFKEDFDDQLTCGVCLDQYTNPKTLPCLHSFCLHCIERIPVEIKDGKYYISCPTCRVDHLLPQGGANSLPSDFKINSLLDLRKKLVTTKIFTPTSQSTCPQHNDLLTVYCETCCQVICRDCTISTEHNRHIFYLISECYPKHHQQILCNLDLVKYKLADMNTALTQLDTREREVVEQGENVKEQINTHAQQLIDKIQRSRTHLTQQVDTIVQRKTKTLTAQRQQAQKLQTQLKTCQDMIEHSLKEWNQQQILTQKNTMMEEINTATQHVDPAVFKPIEEANIQFKKLEKEMGSIIHERIAYGKATLEVSPCTAKQPSTATLTLHSQNDSPFSLPPSLISSTLSSSNNHFVKCPITQTQPGKYNISFTPSTRNDQLRVQVGGVDVPDSPFTLPVIPTLEMELEPVNIILTVGLIAPYGIAVCHNGDIVVTESFAPEVTILNHKGEKVKSFGPFDHPRGVAVSIDGHILVTDNHRLQKLTTDGVCVKSVGSETSGCGQLQFFYPMGIAVHPTTGQIFVADNKNNRIQVFSNDLTFSHTISPTRLSLSSKFHRRRARSPQFDRPCNIAIDNEGYLYIIDDFSQYIFKVSGSTGKLIKKFSVIGNDDKLIYPAVTSLTVHNTILYVGECNHKDTILVFDTEGKFLHSFGLRFNPQSMSTDEYGNLYISDSGYNKPTIIVV